MRAPPKAPNESNVEKQVTNVEGFALARRESLFGIKGVGSYLMRERVFTSNGESVMTKAGVIEAKIMKKDHFWGEKYNIHIAGVMQTAVWGLRGKLVSEGINKKKGLTRVL